MPKFQDSKGGIPWESPGVDHWLRVQGQKCKSLDSFSFPWDSFSNESSPIAYFLQQLVGGPLGWRVVVASRHPRTQAVLQSNIGLLMARNQRLWMSKYFCMNIPVAWGCWKCSPFRLSNQFWNLSYGHGFVLNARCWRRIQNYHRRLSISPHIMPHAIPTLVEGPLNPKWKLHSGLHKDEMDCPLWCIGFEETESI